MRKIHVFLLMLAISCLAIAVLILPAAGASVSSVGLQAATAPAASMEVKTGLGIEKMELTGASDSFKIAPETKIYAWTRVKDVAAGSNVAIAFVKGDKEVFKKEIPVPSVPYRVNAYRTFRAADAGDWKVVVAGADGKELASSSFKVEISK